MKEAIQVFEKECGSFQQGRYWATEGRIEDKVITTSLTELKNLVGCAWGMQDVKEALEGLGFSLKVEAGGMLGVKVPTFRLDVEYACDLAEDIARFYSYDSVLERPFRTPMDTFQNYPQSIEEDKVDFLVSLAKGMGCHEMINYSFTSSDFLMRETSEKVELPLSRQMAFLRDSLLPNMVKSFLAMVTKMSYEECASLVFFEEGRIFGERIQKREERSFALVGLGEKGREILKTFCDTLREDVGQMFVYTPYQESFFEEGDVTTISAQGKAFALWGRMSQKFMKKVSGSLKKTGGCICFRVHDRHDSR